MAINTPSKTANRLGSGFTNLQRVLQANKSNKLGATVGGGVQKAGQAAQSTIQQAGQQFKTNVDAENERLASERSRVSRVLGGNVAQATQDDVNAFEGIRGGQTKAKTKIENADELAQKGREAQSLGQATGSEGGRFGLLQRYVGGNQRYTGGQQRLDNVLLGQTGQSDLRKARVANSGLEDEALGTAFAAEQQGIELKNKAKGLADETVGKLSDSTSAYDAAMRQKAIEMAKAREDRVKGILDSDLEVEEDVYNQLSKILDPKRDNLNTELNDYIKANLEKANRFGVQGQSDFDKIKMLQRLTGNSAAGDAGKLLEEYNLKNAGEVGAFDKSGLFTVPSDIALDEGIRAKETEYGGKTAANRSNIQTATRHLADSQPGIYTQTGGYYGDLLSVLGKPQHDQNVINQFNSMPQMGGGKVKGPDGALYSLEQWKEKNPYNPSRVGVPDSRGDINSFNGGSNYINNVFGGHMSQIEAAKAAFANQNMRGLNVTGSDGYFLDNSLLSKIAAEETRLKAAEAKQKEDDKFHRLGRLLRKKPAAAT